MATFKQMNYIREQYPEAKIYVFYIDLRTPGKYEKFREKLMADENATFIKGKVADMNIEADGTVTVIAENAVTGDKIQQTVDMAVLATGMQPSFAEGGAPAGVTVDENGFVISDMEKGMIAAGCAKKAADVVTTTQSSTAAALKAIQVSGR
jgi:quinone-modifying oxidoreductase subunit QmoA